MNNKYLYLALSFSTAALSACSADNKQAEQPNLLYIFPDQFRFSALSLWSDPEFRDVLTTKGDPVHTPNIDKLLKDGVIFTQATSTHPLSSPHRAMLLSGMYPHSNGIENVNSRLDRDQELHHDIECFTDVLANTGYETAYVGKTHWHKTERLFDKQGNFVNSLEEPGGQMLCKYDTYIPEGKSRHSNKYWVQVLRDDHYNPSVYSNRPELIEGKSDGEQYRPHEFSSTYEANAIIKYIRNEDGERIADAPFSLFWALNPPHPPYSKMRHCNEKIFNKHYKDLTIEELLVRENVRPALLDANQTSEQIETLRLSARIYFTLIEAIDFEIGRVLAALDEAKLTDNTVVVFTSDHGEMMSSHSKMQKNEIYDESFLVPFGVRYPKVLSNRTEDLLLGSIDIMPTILGLMGLENKIPASVEGCDYSDILEQGEDSNVEKPESALYLYPTKKGVRTDRYSYLVSNDGTYQLFDNIEDPYQLTSINLESLSSDEQQLLKSQLGMWLTKAHDAWADNKVCDGLITY